jgi:hypothetical protein
VGTSGRASIVANVCARLLRRRAAKEGRRCQRLAQERDEVSRRAEESKGRAAIKGTEREQMPDTRGNEIWADNRWIVRACVDGCLGGAARVEAARNEECKYAAAVGGVNTMSLAAGMRPSLASHWSLGHVEYLLEDVMHN